MWNIFDIHGGLALFYGEILIFAGLSYIMIAIFKKYNLSNRQMLAIAVVMSVIGSLVRFIDFANPIANTFIGYFIGIDVDLSSFPILNWFIFPVIGVIYGDYFIRCKDKKWFFKFWPVCLLISIIYFVATVFIPIGFLSSEPTYYFMTTFDVIFCLIYIHGNLGFCYWISRFLPEKVTKATTVISRNITAIYIAQWYLIIISFAVLIIIDENMVFNDLSMMLLSCVILILSIIVTYFFKKAIMKRKAVKN